MDNHSSKHLGYLIKNIVLILFLLLCLIALPAYPLKVNFQIALYPLAWWVLIFLASSLGNESSNPLKMKLNVFLSACNRSAFIWCLFELVNIRIDNWYYQNIPDSLLYLGLSTFLSFATVEFILLLSGRAAALITRPLRKKDKDKIGKYILEPDLVPIEINRIRILLGVGSLGLILIWPTLFFPFLWVIPLVFLQISRRKIMSILFSPILWATGLLCGILWESINYFSGAKWVYSLPYLNEPRIFEMPLAGYLGFLIFPLSYIVLRKLILPLQKKIEGQFLLVVFVLIMGLFLIPRYSVTSFLH